MDRIKRFTMAVFLAARRVLVPSMLFCVYFLALGPMALIMRLFGLMPKVKRGPLGYWREARSGAADTGEAAGQS
jgi:hypothetical protein